MKILLFIFTFLVSLNAFSQMSSESGKVINEFSGAAPVPGTIRNMAWGEAPEEYVVQPGDSLYDICDQLVAEGDYWPKLWSMNPEIKNPHFIYPGMRIRFYAGDDSNPPFLQVVSDEEVIPIEKGEVEQAALIKEDFVVPKEADWSYFVDPTPPEIIDEKAVEIPGDIAGLFEVVGGFYSKESSDVHVPGFILNDIVEEIGAITYGREGELAPGPGQLVYVDYEDSIQSGATYTVLREGEKVYHPDTGDFIGYKYYFISNIKITQVDSEEHVAKGLLLDGKLLTKKGDMVVPYRSSVRSVRNLDVVPAGTSNAHVISMEFPDQHVAGEGSFVFLDSHGGVAVGQTFPVYQNIKYDRFGVMINKPIETDYSLVGKVQVIDVTEAGAIGVIMDSKREILIGDRLIN